MKCIFGLALFSFGLTNFLSLSDRMSDMLKKFSTSLHLSVGLSGSHTFLVIMHSFVFLFALEVVGGWQTLNGKNDLFW